MRETIVNFRFHVPDCSKYHIVLRRFSLKSKYEIFKIIFKKSEHLYAGLVAASVAVSLSVSCNKGNGSGETSMKDDPAGTYEKFLTEIRGQNSLSTDELAGQIGHWRTIKDSVFYYAVRDTAGNQHSTMYAKCQLLHDSLRTEFTRLAQSRNRDFYDVFVLIEHISISW